MAGWIETLTDPNILVAALVSMAVLATFYSLVAPLLERGDLAKRMKSVATEREQIRARERARLNAEATTGRASLRAQHNTSVREIVERLNLRKALVDDNTVNRLKTAGYRSQNALNTFLFARFCLPFLFLTVAVLYIFVLGNFADKPIMPELVVARLQEVLPVEEDFAARMACGGVGQELQDRVGGDRFARTGLPD